MKKNNYIFLFAFLFTCFHCKNSSSKESKPQNSDDGYIAVIEIPAGTNKKFEYNHEKNTFECEIINGKERTIDYLPYPGNYGYIKNTYMNPELGGDGDALDILIISESITMGSNVHFKPLGIIKLLDKGEEDHKIIAIPKEGNLTFMKDSIPESVKTIIKTWFCNYKGINKMKFLSWGDKDSAIKEIEKWKI